MINHFSLLDEDKLSEIEDKYASSNRNIITFSGGYEPDDEYIADPEIYTEFDSDFQEE